MLSAWHEGDEAALDHLLPIVYDELRRLARQQTRSKFGGRTLQPTGLVREAYLE